jgi:hypothetical protein
VGGCARLRWSAAGVRSVSSARLRCARALWAVSGRRRARWGLLGGVGGGGPGAGALGAGRSGWAGPRGCPRRRPVCGPFPRLGFAACGRCGPSRETRQGSRVAPWGSRRGRVLDYAQDRLRYEPLHPDPSLATPEVQIYTSSRHTGKCMLASAVHGRLTLLY